MKRFDRKFGVDFLSGLPSTPAVYLFKDADGAVLYTGKAKNIRRRLSSYRNASRRKAHRKMRTLVREAHSIEVRPQPSEAEALLVENQLIREFHPPYNVDGAFDFLYPAIGTGLHEDRLLLCLTSEPDLYDELELEWHGSYRPRSRAREAFDALSELFRCLGHLEPRSRVPQAPRRKGTLFVAFRRIPSELRMRTREFLAGESDGLLEEVCTRLLESSEARRTAGEIEQALRFLQDFYRHDICGLRDARIAAGREDAFVPQEERDSLFIRARHGLDQKRAE